MTKRSLTKKTQPIFLLNRFGHEPNKLLSIRFSFHRILKTWQMMNLQPGINSWSVTGLIFLPKFLPVPVWCHTPVSWTLTNQAQQNSRLRENPNLYIYSYYTKGCGHYITHSIILYHSDGLGHTGCIHTSFYWLQDTHVYNTVELTITHSLADHEFLTVFLSSSRTTCSLHWMSLFSIREAARMGATCHPCLRQLLTTSGW